ncbi:hypothetical protein LQU94_07450 [Peptoniphilus sp. KCTC 25270]|uniref:acyl CoA:acetate/3-ketoacid CoA transferase n=1 Tax=Peptoniphilus sp. KCTC 25270 TaxID=2897414 RepID=UPI001E4F845B|nr:CoA-transferase [Peptoniphilus sp. KCTC 25270]MCD1147946.1 hypothetical protein [Peptoniphilus sp. KCTC 25270]
MKKLTVQEAAEWIKDGDTVAFSGFLLTAFAREIVIAMKEKFEKTGSPKNLTVMHASGCGNNADQGVFELMEREGLVSKYICGHYTRSKRSVELVNRNAIESHNLPIGMLCKMYQAKIEGKIGEFSKIGLHTFVDPRYSGGKMNSVTKDDLVELVDIQGEEYLLYKAPNIDIGIIRGTTVDEHGNLTMEEEASFADALEVAMATKASGGKVIAQVKYYVKDSSIDRPNVKVPGIFVDGFYVTEDAQEYHRQTPGELYSPILSGYNHTDITSKKVPLVLDERKIIARRAAFEIKRDTVVNLGFGIPENIALVADEEGMIQHLVLTVESGIIGGIPLGGKHFGAAVNAWATMSMSQIFDYYNGGGLDISFLGFAEVDPYGDVNVNKFGPSIAGVGGFIDISQSTKQMVFCGTMTSGGLKIKIENGNLVIVQEGKRKKFVKEIETICYNSRYGVQRGQNCIFITERCVFRPTEDGLELIEIAPGIDIDRDIKDQMEFPIKVSKDLKTMDPRIFNIEPMELRKAF